MEQSIPLLDETLTGLGRHFNNMDNASQNTGKISPLDVRAAKQTVQAVTGLVKSIKQALDTIATNSIEIRTHVSILLPTGVASVGRLLANPQP